MKNKTRYVVTAALPYANGPLHIGHIAGAYLPADIFVRFLRSKNIDVLFVCGSDEHGAAITLRAKKEKQSPKEIVDKYHNINKKAFEKFGISFDIFHRTSSEIHKETSQDFFLQLYKQGRFIEEENEQYYDEEYKIFLADRYITGECPKCGYHSAYGDQCEKCCSALNPQDLVNPVSILSGKKPVLKKTKHWYLSLNKDEKWLRKWIEEGILDNKKHHNPKQWRNQVIGQCKSWLDSGLKPRAVTRDLDWGVPVPLKNVKDKVLYVWFDAPIGYISATKQWAIDNKSDWKKYWMDGNSKLIHFIGKDNIVFHCIIFPVILKSYGKYNLPYNIPANEFLNLEGEKISTSRNWAVWIDDYLNDFPGKEDELRFVLTSIAPEQKDSEFTWKDFQARVNNELLAIFGNFIHRTLTLIHKYYKGKIPHIKIIDDDNINLLNEINKLIKKTEKNIFNFNLREGLNNVMNIARIGNKFLTDNEPWKLYKSNPEKCAEILFVSLQIVAKLSIVSYPFMPNSSKKIFSFLNLKCLSWENSYDNIIINSNKVIKKPEILFEKINDKDIQIQIEKLKKKSSNSN